MPVWVVVLVALAVPAAGKRVPCHEILREVNRMTARRATVEVHPSAIARKLGTEQDWVERCLTVYGRPFRNVTRPGETDRLTDATVERWETGEWEGATAEEMAERERTEAREKAEQQLRPGRRLNLRRELLDDPLEPDLLDDPFRR